MVETSGGYYITNIYLLLGFGANGCCNPHELKCMVETSGGYSITNIYLLLGYGADGCWNPHEQKNGKGGGSYQSGNYI